MRRERAFVIGLDVGTSSIKAVLYDDRLRPVPRMAVRQPIAPNADSELDADALCALVVHVVARLLRRAGARRASNIAGVGAASFWHGMVAADESGRALSPLYLWSDNRSAAEARTLRESVDAEAAWRRTGCPIHQSYWPAKLSRLLAQRPGLRRADVRWLSFADLLYRRLFGRLGTSISMASGTGLFRLDDCRWDEELAAALGIRLESLPPIAQIEQGLEPRYRKVLPQLAEVPWTHAAGDGALANLGSGCITPHSRAVTIGTSGALRVMHGPASAPLAAGLWRYRLDETRLVSGGAVNNGGNLREWLTANLRVERVRGGYRPGSHGLTFLPLLFGERSPGYATDAFGAVAGLKGSTSAQDMAQAAQEAVAVQLAQIDRTLDAVVERPQRLVASGTALRRSPGWMQMIADATGRPVTATRDTEATSRGAALFAMDLLGMELPPAEIATGRTFRPSRANAAAYRNLEARQESLYRALIVDRVLEHAP